MLQTQLKYFFLNQVFHDFLHMYTHIYGPVSFIHTWRGGLDTFGTMYFYLSVAGGCSHTYMYTHRDIHTHTHTYIYMILKVH